MKAAGAEGATLTFYVTEGGSGMLDPIPMGTTIQADLKAIGLNVKVEPILEYFLGQGQPRFGRQGGYG